MTMTEDKLRAAIQNVAGGDKHVAAAVQQVGFPGERLRTSGFPSLLRILVGQQLSVKAAASIWDKFEKLVGEISPASVMRFDIETLRTAGLSRQKAVYAHSVAEAVLSGRLDLDRLHDLDDDAAKDHICSVKGLGPWSAEIYLLFCAGRHDIWPSGDLALQVALQRLKSLPERPKAKETIPIVEPWRPFRGPMAVFLWHYYALSDAPM